jgi:hypothetical protein
MKLLNLVGRHTLTGFDRDIPDIGNIGSWDYLTNGICFILDGKKYQLYENPHDGYRSFISEVYEDQNVKCKNIFNGVDVFIVKPTNSISENVDAIIMYSAKTGNEILTIGTFNCDDYYPYCKSYLDVKQLNKEIRGVS